MGAGDSLSHRTGLESLLSDRVRVVTLVRIGVSLVRWDEGTVPSVHAFCLHVTLFVYVSGVFFFSVFIFGTLVRAGGRTPLSGSCL